MSQRLRQRNGCKFFMTCTAQPPEMDKTRAGRGIATILNFFPALPCHQTHFHNRLTTTGRTVVPTADNNNNRLRARQWIYFLQRSKRNARSQHVARHSKKRKTENSPIRSRTRGREDSSTSVGSSGRIPVDQFEEDRLLGSKLCTPTTAQRSAYLPAVPQNNKTEVRRRFFSRHATNFQQTSRFRRRLTACTVS